MSHQSVSKVLLFVVSLALSMSASGQDYYEPEASAVSGGSYTVSFVTDCGSLPYGYYCVATDLQERIGDGGTWNNVASQYGVASFAERVAGTYYYRVHVAAYVPGFGLFEAHSPVISVVVDPLAERDPILEQLVYEYSVRQGDINGDGKADFYIDRVSGGQLLNGTIGQLILQQGAGAQFFAIVPTLAQSALASSWNLSAVEPRLEDLNADGYVDVALTGLDEVVAGADDQFIYAPGQPGLRAPAGVRAFDSDMIRFVSDAMDYMYDQDYFSNYAPVYYYTDVYQYAYCDVYASYDAWYHPLDYGLLYYWTFQDLWLPQCYVDYSYQTGIYQDFSGFSEQALNLWHKNYLASAGEIDEQDALAEVMDDIEQLLGVRVGGWPMEELLGPVGTHQDPFIRTGIEMGRSLVAQARSGRNRTTSTIAPPQVERLPDHIYITGHPLTFARSHGHLAVEYVGWHGGTGMPGLAETLSAGPEFDSLVNNGKLIAEFNRPTDHPLFNLFIAEVEPQNSSDYVYWETYLKARHENYIALPHDQKVDYAFVPLSWSGSYNSNSYVSGITTDSPANVSIDVPFGIGSRYPGWSKPVPDQLFR